MINTIKFVGFVLIFIHANYLTANTVDVLNKKIDAEQDRIDRFDELSDGGTTLQTVDQSLAATRVYITNIDRLREIIVQSSLMPARKNDMLQLVLDHMLAINRGNYLFFAAADRLISFRLKMFKQDQDLIEANIMADQTSASMSLPFFAYKPQAVEWLVKLSHLQAPMMMKYFKFIAYEPYASTVLRTLIRTDPMRFKDYIGTASNLSTMARSETDPVAKTIIQIYQQYNIQSRAYLLLEEILSNGMRIEDAHEISSDPQGCFRH